jgi:hypothetical protein
MICERWISEIAIKNQPAGRDRIFTSAQRDARYMLRMVPKRMIYIIPYERLINALIREQRAAVRVNGSSAAPGI